MYIRLFLLSAFATLAAWTNVAATDNIAHGVQVVVIDPGHGGWDPGACYGGVRECDLVLKIALKLGAMIEDEMPGVKVVYTRKTDKALGQDKLTDLQARANIANKAKGDLFISIHANAAKATVARGVETLVMGESTKEQNYNEQALYESNRDDLLDMSDERTAAIVRAYIQTLQLTYGQFSVAMANCTQNNYLKTGRSSRGVKRQPLRVLYATDMPGVLTEIGFLSNPQELAYLRSDKGQSEIVKSLFTAVRDYSKYVLGIRLADEGPGVATALPEPEPVKPAPQPAKNDIPSQQQQQQQQSKPSGTQQQPAKPAAAQPQEVKFTVQLLASQRSLPLSAADFKSYRNNVKEYTAEGAYKYKYCVGEYDTQAEAQRRQTEVRKEFPGAFVVRCKGTRIVK